jgi:mannan polymerase II complex MNN10 subunit
LLRCRDFDGVAALTFPNLQIYATQHGYEFFDASALIDTSRPPAWSKIKAVQYLMGQQKHHQQAQQLCDWVFWIDADIVVMNSTVNIESFLPAHNSNIDLLVTMDRRLTANSGAWLIRNSAWSRDFLDTWWNMRTWVREPGLSLSGDNAAFGHLIENYSSEGPSSRIKMVPRCTFNSFAVFVKEGSSTADEKNQDWYLSENYYHHGDFMAHASGVDQKKNCVEMLLQYAV